MDWPTHEKYQIECPKNKTDFTVYGGPLIIWNVLLINKFITNQCLMLLFSYKGVQEQTIYEYCRETSSRRWKTVNLWPTQKRTASIILWKHFISWGWNFFVWRRRTYSWVIDFVECPTHEIKNKKKLIHLQILTDAKLRPNTETGSIAKLRISEWLCLLCYVTAESHQTTLWHQTVN